MKILFDATTYTIGEHMGGIGVRLWELAQVLSKEHDITFLIRQKPESSFRHINISFEVYKESTWKEIINECDVLFTSDLPETKFLLYAHEKNKLIISENSVPIEHLEYGSVKNHMTPNREYWSIIGAFKLQVLLTDYFIARSSVERAILLGSFGLLGRLNYYTYEENENLDNLISLIPIGFNQFSDTHSIEMKPTGKLIDFLWNGGIWDYYDPSMVAKAVELLKQEEVSVDVMFMYKPPSDQYITEKTVLDNIIQELNIEDSIHFLESSLPHSQRDQLLKSSRAIIAYGKNTIENYTCHRLRLRDVYLYDLPIIVDDFGSTAELVKQYGIGLTVRNERELANAMYRMKYDEELYAKLKENIKKVRDKFRIENNMNSLTAFLANNEKARDTSYDYKNELINNMLENKSYIK